MTTKQWTLIALAVALGSLSLYLNRDWFAGDDIQIHYRSRPVEEGYFGGRRGGSSAINPVFFQFDRKVKLTSLRVVPCDALATNKYAHALWHLISESNSLPLREITYGVPIRGMHPYDKGAQPEQLEPGVKYRLLIEAGRAKAEHDFVPTPRG
jgi:hypothetical protein